MRMERKNSQSLLGAIALAVVFCLGNPAQAGGTLFGAAHVGRDGPSTLYTIDPMTGAVTEVGPIGFERCSGMDFDASGTLFATCERSDGSEEHVLITIDPLTGAGTEVGPTGVASLSGPFPASSTAPDVSFRNSDNTLFGYTFPGDGLATIDLGTGAMTQLGFPSGAVPEGGYGIAFSPADTLFLATTNRLYFLNHASSAATLVTGLTYIGCPIDCPSVSRPNAMDFDPLTGQLYASVHGGFLGRFLGIIDTETGDVTFIGLTVEGMDALAWSPAVAAIPFAALEVSKARIEFGPWGGDDRFKIEGEVTLDETSDGINPAEEDVVVSVGTAIAVIPAGSFTEKGYGKFKFKGLINDAVVKMEIKQKYADTFRFKIEAKGVDLTGTANPMDITLTIGDDIGTATISLEGELKFKAEREDEDDDKDKDKDKDDDDDDDDKDRHKDKHKHRDDD